MKRTVHTQGVSQRLTALGAHTVPPYAEHRDGVVLLQRLQLKSRAKANNKTLQAVKLTMRWRWYLQN